MGFDCMAAAILEFRMEGKQEEGIEEEEKEGGDKERPGTK